jgi:YbbR domain-containing protein
MKNKKLLTFLISLCVAFVLWGYVITVEKPDSEESYKVEVTLSDDDIALLHDRGLMPQDYENLTVTLKVSGSRSHLKNLRSSDLAVVVNLSGVREKGKQSFTYRIPDLGNVEVVSSKPEKVDISIVEWEKKEIPVVVDTTALPDPSAYVVKNIKTDFTEITISGPKTLVDQVHQAKVMLDLSGYTATDAEDHRVSLCDSEGRPINDVSDMDVEGGDVHVTFTIHPRKNVPLEYLVLPGGGLTEEDVVITVTDTENNPVEWIDISGRPGALEKVNLISLGEIDLSQITEDTKLLVPIDLDKLELTNHSEIQEVVIHVDLPEQEIRSYENVTQIRFINAPQNMTIRPDTTTLTVKLQAMGPILDQITEENITLVVDLKNAKTGPGQYPATIALELPEELPEVQVVGEYQLTVTIVKDVDKK